MEVPVHLAVIKLNCNCVVCFLVDCPHNSSQVQTYIKLVSILQPEHPKHT